MLRLRSIPPSHSYALDQHPRSCIKLATVGRLEPLSSRTGVLEPLRHTVPPIPRRTEIRPASLGVCSMGMIRCAVKSQCHVGWLRWFQPDWASAPISRKPRECNINVVCHAISSCPCRLVLGSSRSRHATPLHSSTGMLKIAGHAILPAESSLLRDI